MKIDRNKLNILKNYVMLSIRFCEQVYETGFDTYDQFQSFTNMCENHVNYCNTWLMRLKPIIPIGKNYNMYKEFKFACAYTVSCLNKMVHEWKSNYDNAVEEAKAFEQLEKRSRLEHELSIEYRDYVYDKDRENDNKRKPIGFIIPTKKKRKYTKNKNVNTGESTDTTSNS